MPFFVYLRAKIDVSPEACWDTSLRHHVGTQCFSTRSRLATHGMRGPGLLIRQGERGGGKAEGVGGVQVKYSTRRAAPWGRFDCPPPLTLESLTGGEWLPRPANVGGKGRRGGETPMGRGNSRSSRLEVVANRMILPVKCKGRQSTLSSGS